MRPGKPLEVISLQRRFSNITNKGAQKSSTRRRSTPGLRRWDKWW